MQEPQDSAQSEIAGKSGEEIIAYIKEKYDKKGEVFLGLVHRLDTLTSGIMVFARTSKAA